MGQPDPCVLFSQTFVHPNLDEYVDEVLFAEPIVITACEFLEQNASSTSQSVTLVGATLPPSFALEVFVHCEGETRFKRLCQPFLYSHSSSNVLEVEAVVTNHLVVRGSYRSLTLVIYGNTAEDLGQFNIEFDDNSITNLVSSAEGKLEDLPLPLRSNNLKIVESISALKVLSVPLPVPDISIEAKLFLLLLSKMWELPIIGDALDRFVSIVVSAATSYITQSWGKFNNYQELQCIIRDIRREVFHLYQQELGNASTENLADSFLQSEVKIVSSKQLVSMLSHFFCFKRESLVGYHQISQRTYINLGLSVALLLCSGRESCFHFVSGGGMEQIVHVFSLEVHNSTPTMLLLLGVVEQATRHSFGCERFLGWWAREGESVPSGISEGYSSLLNLLLQKPRHDVFSSATYILHRLRLFELAARYESAVLSVLRDFSTDGTGVTLDMLITIKSLLKKLLKLIKSHGLIEDPSPMGFAIRSLSVRQTESMLSYKGSSSLISSYDCGFSNTDIDLHLLTLLKERGFLPLSVALLSSTKLRSEVGHPVEIFLDIASYIETIILSLLFCRSGLIFLLQQPELYTTVMHALIVGDDLNKEICVPLRYAFVLITKGFFCDPGEVGMVIGMHLRVVYAIDRLLTIAPQSEEFLWVLWELCALARSHCGRQALLSLVHFPEAVTILMEALHSAKEPEPVAKANGALPLNLAIFYSAAELFEVIVSDSTASSLCSWIGCAMELHRALHSSSPGSHRKDAPTRLLDWIDAGIVYHKNGAVGLLRYAAVLASGGDAHLSSTTAVVSDLTDVENIIGDVSSGSDVNVMDNLCKFISEKSFDGVSLRDSSVAQLTTAFRILAFISENSAVAAALYDEGAITVIYTILVNSRVMLERSSNNYDYLVDEGTETNSTSDLLLERDREQSLIDLLVPSLMLLINLLLKLKESEEQHRNTKLMNALIRLHREASPKLAASAADLSSSYPESALGFGSICHLIASALAFWPVYGWTPGLFNSLLASVQSTPLLALGPKETCSLLCVLNDLLPEEGVWLWKNGMPLLSALRTLSVGTLLGPQKEEKVNWYRQPTHLEKLLGQLAPHLDKIAQIIQHYAISELVVIQDMLRVFVMRITYQKSEYGSVLLRPILSWIRDIVCDASYPFETDIYKVYKCLDFLASLLEHPHAKALLLKEGFIRMLTRVLRRCLVAIDSDDKQILDSRNSSKSGLTILSWGLPIFKSCTVLFDSQTSTHGTKGHDLHALENLSAEHRVVILAYILRFCQVLPIGKELLACLVAFKEIGSQKEGQSSLAAIFKQIHSSVEEPGAHRGNERDGCGVYQLLNEFEWKKQPPLLICLKKLLTSVDSKESLSGYSIQALNTLCLGSLYFCMDKESLHLDRLAAMKFFFAVADEMDTDRTYDAPEENPNNMLKLLTSLSSKIAIDNPAANHDAQTALSQVLDSAKSLLLLLKSDDLVKVEDLFTTSAVPLSPVDLLVSPKIHQLSDGSSERSEDFFYIGFGDKFLWECPETLPDRFSQNPGKRKMPSVEGPNRRARAETSPADITAQNTFSRVLGSSTTPGPTRRDTFRQRKPNTSRPPSMHVDDYVARERNVDGITNSNVIAVQRVGSTSGRPPSIHVDEFMARQRERQNPMAAVVGDVTPQVKSAAHVNDTVAEKASKPEQVKADLDDELQGIDIVFDGEESESDDKLPFLQPDDNLQQHAPVIVEQNSPHSIVEETESDVHGSSQFSHFDTPIASNFDENTQSEFSSRMSISLPEIPLTREPSVSSDKKYFEQVDDHKSVMNIKTSGGFVSGAGVGNTCFPGSVYSNLSASPVQLPVDARMTPQKFYVKNSPPAGNATVAMGSQGLYDQRFLNQPPLPPMPPPLTVPPLISQTSDAGPSHSSPFMNSIADVHQPLAPSFQVHSDYLSTFSNSSSLLGSSLPMQDNKYSRTSISSPSGSARHHPPLPPTPPPFSSSPYNLTSNRTATPQSSVYNQAMELPQSSTAPPPDARLGGLSSSGSRANDYSPSLQPQSVYSRSGSIPVSLYRNIPVQQQGENPASILQNLSNPQSTVPSVHSLTQLQPLQPPQLPLPPQPPQHLRPPIQALQQIDHGMPLQNTLQMPLHSLQIPQQPQISPVHTFRNSSHQHVQPQAINPPCDLATLQHQDPGMSLHEYFKSPEAIQSLLSDRDKLCQLLEQHPKLMQLLQEKLGQQ